MMVWGGPSALCTAMCLGKWILVILNSSWAQASEPCSSMVATLCPCLEFLPWSLLVMAWNLQDKIKFILPKLPLVRTATRLSHYDDAEYAVPRTFITAEQRCSLRVIHFLICWETLNHDNCISDPWKNTEYFFSPNECISDSLDSKPS